MILLPHMLTVYCIHMCRYGIPVLDEFALLALRHDYHVYKEYMFGTTSLLKHVDVQRVRRVKDCLHHCTTPGPYLDILKVLMNFLPLILDPKFKL